MIKSSVAGLLGLLLLASTAPSSAAAAPHRTVPLRMATYNIAAGRNADQTFELDTTVDALRSLDAEVIALQEVDKHWSDRSEWRDMVEELGRALNMHTAFAPIYSLDPLKSGEPRREYGLALLSRLPITEVNNHELTRQSSIFPDQPAGPMPGFLEAVIKVRGRPVHVYNTHLDSKGDPTLRAIEIQETLEILGQDPEGVPQIVAGDFNAEPGAPELAPLWDTMADGWAVAEETVGGPLTFPSIDPVKRIDLITVSESIAVRRATVPSDPAVLTSSDHAPMVADLLLPR